MNKKNFDPFFKIRGLTKNIMPPSPPKKGGQVPRASEPFVFISPPSYSPPLSLRRQEKQTLSFPSSMSLSCVLSIASRDTGLMTAITQGDATRVASIVRGNARGESVDVEEALSFSVDRRSNPCIVSSQNRERWHYL